jgi:hypothetical protein
MRRCDTGEEAVMARWGILCPGCEGSLFRMANGGVPDGVVCSGL